MFLFKRKSTFFSTSCGKAAMGCWEIKQTAACCSFRKRLEALTYIGQMLGRQLERVGRSDPEGTQGLQEEPWNHVSC